MRHADDAAGVPGPKFTIKDSGSRATFEGGMIRDVTTGKVGYWRIFDGPMLVRWAEHLTKGAVKYPDIAPGVPNWTLASGPEEMFRAKDSALRHFVQWFLGEDDEDHAAAVFFNVNLYEYVKGRLNREHGGQAG